jgi:uncharacterized OB-fold protein
MASSPGAAPAPLIATHTIEYAYQRSVGPVLGRFFSALQEGRILGARTADGRVLCPPAEYDPETGAATDEMVEVGPGGTVTSWTWVDPPKQRQGFDRAFAFALIRLDGADTELLHRVGARDPAALSTGMRVLPRFRAEPEGGIRDLECFVPEGEGAAS